MVVGVWLALATLGCQGATADRPTGVLALAPLLDEPESARGITTIVKIFRRHTRTFEMIPRNEPWSAADAIDRRYALVWTHARTGELDAALAAAAPHANLIVWTRPPGKNPSNLPSSEDLSAWVAQHRVSLLILDAALPEAETAAAIESLLTQLRGRSPAAALELMDAASQNWMLVGQGGVMVALRAPHWWRAW